VALPSLLDLPEAKTDTVVRILNEVEVNLVALCG
jgi:hypothetical protein